MFARRLHPLLIGVVAACGRYDVNLLVAGPDASDAAGAGSHDAGEDRTASNDAGDDGAQSEGAAEGGIESDAGRACTPPGQRVCLDNGAACVVDPECCSSVCTAGYCMPDRTCMAPGAPCTSRGICCSGRCEPKQIPTDGGLGGGVASLVCLNICLADGAPCRNALDCCSMGCHAAVCGAPLCGGLPDAGLQRDTACQSDDTRGLCLGTGSFCSAASAHPCCSGVCDLAAGRCAFGPGPPCLPVGSICSLSADCCRGTCSATGTGASVCTAPCLADRSSCGLGADCCSGHCNGAPGACGGTPAACKLIARPCLTETECCSGQCLGGSCGSNCQVP